MAQVKKKNKYFVDANYFIRFLIDDSAKQVAEVEKLFLDASRDKVNLHTSVLVIFEIKWVLSSLYEFKKTRIVDSIEELLSLDFIKFEEKDLLKISLGLYRYSNLSLEDCYHLVLAKSLNVDSIATFDKKLSRYFKKYE
ncbi:type II toxin-antitoxin system VapC family toxin [bacterium]|nr:type II toxin-antitoxin system VapC family toxin [bacterium]